MSFSLCDNNTNFSVKCEGCNKFNSLKTNSLTVLESTNLQGELILPQSTTQQTPDRQDLRGLLTTVTSQNVDITALNTPVAVIPTAITGVFTLFFQDVNGVRWVVVMNGGVTPGTPNLYSYALVGQDASNTTRAGNAAVVNTGDIDFAISPDPGTNSFRLLFDENAGTATIQQTAGAITDFNLTIKTEVDADYNFPNPPS